MSGTILMTTSPIMIDIKEAKKRYLQQKYNAGSRNIGWDISFEDWYRIWDESGKWAQRGKGKGKYVMSRHNDIGPYAVGNVTIKTQEENSHEASAGERNRAKTRGHLISAALKGRPKPVSICNVCNRSIANPVNLIRWHNDKCKAKV